MIKTLEYYYEDGTHVKYDKYTIDHYGIIVNKKTGNRTSLLKKGNYNVTNVYDNDEKRRPHMAARGN